MPQSEPRSLSRSILGAWPAVLAVAATYVYFLLFAQFAFLHLLQALLRADRVGAGVVEVAMASMGLAGLVGSLLVGRLHPPGGASRHWLLGGFGLSAVAAGASLGAESFGAPALAVVSAAVGLGAAVLTVSLAVGLRDLAAGAPLGPVIGIGTGLAYWICNLPPLFDGSPATQTAAAITACAFGTVAVTRPRPAAHPAARSAVALEPWIAPADLRGVGFVSVLLSFLVLIWLDSAAFAVIQETLELESRTWAGAERQWLLGAVHAAAAVAAGFALARGAFRSLLLTAFALFTLAFTVLQNLGTWAVITGPIYAIGISFYSTALVAYAAAGDGTRGLAKRWRAAWIFGVGGWVGSALGVGMAQDLHRIPTLFLVVTGAVLLGSFVLARRTAGDSIGGPAFSGPTGFFGPTLAGALVAVFFYAGSTVSGAPPVRPLGEEGASIEASIERGQRIYIREGCLHCHSQYVRPDTVDETAFGPHAPIDREAGPVLIGNRRQGPDLSRVGERRDAAWLERHLHDPRAVSPGSRMPAYPHLFDPHGRDGADLVAYLESLRRP